MTTDRHHQMDTIIIDRGGLWHIKELRIVIKEVRECVVFLPSTYHSILNNTQVRYILSMIKRLRSICDWIWEKRSKSHIRSSEINGFKELKPA